MDLSGEYRISAPRDKVWAALNDADVLRRCIPGCQELEKKSETEMSASVVAKIGPVKATFKGEVTLENLNPPESYTIVGEGKGGVAGFAKGAADVNLAEEGEETVLTYTVKAQVGGKLAQLGSRLIVSTSRKMADEFFGNFKEVVEGGESGEAPAAPAAPTATAASASTTQAATADETDDALDPGLARKPRPVRWNRCPKRWARRFMTSRSRWKRASTRPRPKSRRLPRAVPSAGRWYGA